MSAIGLAVITSSFTPCLPRRLRPCLKSIAAECSSLYIHFNPLPDATTSTTTTTTTSSGSSLNYASGFPMTTFPTTTLPNNDTTLDVLFGIYGYTNADSPQLDLRIIISNVTNLPHHLWHPSQHRIRGRLTRLYTDAQDEKLVSNYVQAHFSLFHSPDNQIHVQPLNIDDEKAVDGNEDGESSSSSSSSRKTRGALMVVEEGGEFHRRRQRWDYDHVVLGGTFDRLHTGHKMLLTASAIIADKSVTVGVTDGAMNRKKKLSELIESTAFRVDAVVDFLRGIKPTVDPIVVPILDPFGPSIVDPRLQAIVVSQETLSGGRAVNAKRAEKGLNTLDALTIPILKDDDDEDNLALSVIHEEKLSSSGQRFKSLGTLLTPPSPPPSPTTTTTTSKRPYVIGLTGGIASGKTSIARRLEKLGAARIDCDALGHSAYKKGTPCYSSLISAFGPGVVFPTTGEIDRKSLGAIVFVDPQKLATLNAIVWPAIKALAMEKIRSIQLGGDGAETSTAVIVVEAAVLLEASWDDFVDEVWVCFVPPEEAVRRVVDRNGIPEDDAKKRLQAQLSNEQRLAKANVALSTLWEPEVTQNLCEKAWRLLSKRIPSDL